jgi:hypothetical protein
MIRNTLFALAAAGAIGVALAPAAQAGPKLNIDLGIGISGGVIHVGSPGYYDDDYVDDGEDCEVVTVRHKKWNKTHTKKVVYYTKELVCG